MAHDQEVMCLNPSTVYWMDVSNNASYSVKKINGIQMGHSKKIFKEKNNINNKHSLLKKIN
jgi:hypothetical protein